jgi:hypothetical protein
MTTALWATLRLHQNPDSASPLKIAQPFMAGFKSPEPSKSVKDDRKRDHQFQAATTALIPLSKNAQRIKQKLNKSIFDRPCRDSLVYLATKPSHKWLGCFQR